MHRASPFPNSPNQQAQATQQTSTHYTRSQTQSRSPMNAPGNSTGSTNQISRSHSYSHSHSPQQQQYSTSPNPNYGSTSFGDQAASVGIPGTDPDLGQIEMDYSDMENEEMRMIENEIEGQGEMEPQSDPSSEMASRSEGEQEKLEDEIYDMESTIQGLDQYKIVDKLGEGTFSSVYKAIDLHHLAYDNYEWTGNVNSSSHSPQSLRPRRNVYVALKRIYVTSSPERIHNELMIMEALRGSSYISYLITAFRSEDQIVAVMPYNRHRDFRDYYRIMPISDMKDYFRCLFNALADTHQAGVMHRDVKPANFLYDTRTGEGVLCDFGLAERFDPTEWHGKCHHTCPDTENLHGVVKLNHEVFSTHTQPGGPLANHGQTSKPRGGGSGGAGGMGPPERVGYLKNDSKPSCRANRAGTRGFRAPEVLLKCQDQHIAVDIWSAGIILLAFLTKRFPLFNSNDDCEALLELATIFGKHKMEQAAMLHNRTFQCSVPTVPAQTPNGRLQDFVLRLNPSIMDPGDHPDPEQYTQDIRDAFSLLKGCLHTDCTRRVTALDALESNFLRPDEELEEEENLSWERQDGNAVDMRGSHHHKQAIH